MTAVNFNGLIRERRAADGYFSKTITYKTMTRVCVETDKCAAHTRAPAKYNMKNSENANRRDVHLFIIPLYYSLGGVSVSNVHVVCRES